MFSILWTVLIGAVVGMVAKFIMPGSNEPKGFILTAILGIVGAFLAGFIGNKRWYLRHEWFVGLHKFCNRSDCRPRRLRHCHQAKGLSQQLHNTLHRPLQNIAIAKSRVAM